MFAYEAKIKEIQGVFRIVAMQSDTDGTHGRQGRKAIILLEDSDKNFPVRVTY